MARVQMIAAYLGVTTSELLGEDPPAAEDAPAGQAELVTIYRSLNQEGQEKLLGCAKDLEDTGRYIKSHPNPGRGKECLTAERCTGVNKKMPELGMEVEIMHIILARQLLRIKA